MATKKDPRLKRAGVSGFNKPKRTPSHPTKSHVVVAKEGDKIKTIRFGQQGVRGDRTMTKRAKSFKARHRKNIAKGKMSAAYWANKSKWQEVIMPSKKIGLYSNIHRKRKRIKAGSGEKMRKPGSKGAPTAKQFKQAAKTAKKPKKRK